jgi:hypothetical protein
MTVKHQTKRNISAHTFTRKSNSKVTRNMSPTKPRAPSSPSLHRRRDGSTNLPLYPLFLRQRSVTASAMIVLEFLVLHQAGGLDPPSSGTATRPYASTATAAAAKTKRQLLVDVLEKWLFPSPAPARSTIVLPKKVPISHGHYKNGTTGGCGSAGGMWVLPQETIAEIFSRFLCYKVCRMLLLSQK